MRLAPCPHCGSLYPTTATVCPSCMRRISSEDLAHHSRRRVRPYVYALALLMGVMGIVVMFVLQPLLTWIFFFLPVPLLTFLSFILAYGTLGFWWGSRWRDITWRWGILLSTFPSILLVLSHLWLDTPGQSHLVPSWVILALIAAILFAACAGVHLGARYRPKPRH